MLNCWTGTKYLLPSPIYLCTFLPRYFSAQTLLWWSLSPLGGATLPTKTIHRTLATEYSHGQRCVNIAASLALPVWTMTLKKTQRVTAAPVINAVLVNFYKCFSWRMWKSQSSQETWLPHQRALQGKKVFNLNYKYLPCATPTSPWAISWNSRQHFKSVSRI